MLMPTILVGSRVRGALRPAGLMVLVLALAAGPVPARAGSEKPAPKNKLEVAVEERLRTENWDNVVDFNKTLLSSGDVRHQLRFRTRVWGKLNLGSRAEIMVGLNDESRKIYTTTAGPSSALFRADSTFHWDEVVFETLYLDYKFTHRLGVRVGRQNLSRGDGLLVMDGSALDGSRTAYFNAIDASLAFGKSKLDLIGISDPSRDQYLPVIHDQHKQLNECDETAAGIGYTENRIQSTVLEGLYLFKTETWDNPPKAPQPERRLHTLDARITRQFPQGISLMGEVAGQLGRQEPDIDIKAWAVQANLKKVFPHPWKPSVAVGWIGLSGDNADTKDANENWDPLFSRYPKWSDMYIYTLVGEKGASCWTNLAMWQAEFQVAPAKPLNLRATYYRMGAFHAYPGKTTIFARGDGGLLRGDLFEARADLKVNDNWRGHLVGEWLKPGDFYVGTDGGWFLRAEVTASFKKVFGL